MATEDDMMEVDEREMGEILEASVGRGEVNPLATTELQKRGHPEGGHHPCGPRESGTGQGTQRVSVHCYVYDMWLFLTHLCHLILG